MRNCDSLVMLRLPNPLTLCWMFWRSVKGPLVVFSLRIRFANWGPIPGSLWRSLMVEGVVELMYSVMEVEVDIVFGSVWFLSF